MTSGETTTVKMQPYSKLKSGMSQRKKTSTRKKIILTIPKSKKVEITGSKKSGWYPVKYKSKKGWVSGTYLK